MTFATAVPISFTSFVYCTNVYWSVIHGIKRKPHLSVVWNWYHFVAIAILHQPRPTDSADINTRLQLSDTSSIPPMHGGFLLIAYSKRNGVNLLMHNQSRLYAYAQMRDICTEITKQMLFRMKDILILVIFDVRLMLMGRAAYHQFWLYAMHMRIHIYYIYRYAIGLLSDATLKPALMGVYRQAVTAWFTACSTSNFIL